MKHDITETIEILEQRILEIEDEAHRRVSSIRTDIEWLRVQGSERTQKEPIIDPGQYKDLIAREAALHYLRNCGSSPVPLTKILDALRQGGFQPKWIESRYQHNFKIMLGQNKHLFSYDEETNTVRLLNYHSKRY